MLHSDTTWGNLVDNGNGYVSAAIFSHPDIYQQELEQIFARMWLFVGHVSQIPRRGDYVRSRMGEEQVIVTRGRDDKVYVLLNSCAHRGNMVCRYDEGNALAFQCSFHGWTFGSDGRLINVSPGTEEEYLKDIRKEDWGLLSARVAVFQGTIWANWDKDAPDFVDYLGGAEDYLGAALCDAEGDPDGTELAGGIMRWRVGLNWKVPMPDLDMTHGWITHRSMRGLAPIQPEDGSNKSRFKDGYHVWWPEGHTTSMHLPDESKQTAAASLGSEFSGDPILTEYMKERAAKRKERLGRMASVRELPHVFPNIGAVGRIFRILHPQGPDSVEMWSYILIDKNAPKEVKEATVIGRQRISGPNGLQQNDDMENWYIQTRYSRGFMTRWGLRQNNTLGMSTPSLHGPSTFGLSGMYHPHPTDENYRRFFERYAHVMQADSWNDMRINSSDSARVGVKV